jgi:uncharacterized membrane protein
MTVEDPTDEQDPEVAETAFVAAERLAFFSDAVVAIAITLLAIDLPLPDGDSSAQLWQGLVDDSFSYLVFAISFVVIAIQWRAHHRLFRWVRAVGRPVIELNLLWLFLVVANPFLTRLITEGEMNFLRFSLYALAQGVQTLVLVAMTLVLRRKGWFSPKTPTALSRRGWIVPLVRSVAFLGSVPFYLLIGKWTFVIWGVLPLVVGPVLRRTGAITSD